MDVFTSGGDAAGGFIDSPFDEPSSVPCLLARVYRTVKWLSRHRIRTLSVSASTLGDTRPIRPSTTVPASASAGRRRSYVESDQSPAPGAALLVAPGLRLAPGLDQGQEGVMRDNYHTWTPEDVAYLRAAYADTLSAEIAAHLGTSAGAVRQKANVLGLFKSADFSSTLTKNFRAF